MATYQRPPVSPVVDAQRASRWPVFLFVAACILAIAGGIAYDRYVANAPIVLTPTKPPAPTTPTPPSRPSQSTSPSTQQPRQAKPSQTSSGLPDWVPSLSIIIPAVIVGVFLLIFIGIVRRAKRAAMSQVSGTGPVAGTGHWQGGQHVGTGGAASGPWARSPGSVTTTSTPQAEPAKRKGMGFPLLPIVVGAIILDQAVFSGRYSREALAWISKFIEGFTR